MKITKEQEKRILKLDANFFDEKLIIGKWYKDTKRNWLMNYQGGGRCCYGFNSKLDYSNDYTMAGFEDWIEASEDEIEEALIKVAIENGYSTENTKCLSGDSEGKLITGAFCYTKSVNRLFSADLGCGGMVLFENGVWASKFKTITKAEAEKILRKKIV